MPAWKIADDRVGAHARDGAERRRRALRRDQRQLSPTREAEALRQADADRDRVVALEIVERAGEDVVGDRRQHAQILRLDAAHQPAGELPARRP